MIRNIVLFQLRPDADPAAVAALQDGLRGLDCPGTLSYTLGDDLGFKDGNWSFGVVADFTDEAAYRGYDLDAEHNRLRGELAAHVAQVARVQFELPDA
jgi:hypothetical protein